MKSYISFFRLISILFLLGITAETQAVDIIVKTDRDPAVMNESFVMTFESNGDVDDEPDFSPLNKDFQVLSTGTSSNMSIINGKISSTKSWTLDVIARRSGKLVIPAISFGKDMSEQSTVNVVDAASGSNDQDERDIFLETEASPNEPYVQSEVLFTIRLYRSVPTSNASLSDPPEVTGATAVIEMIGDDRNYDTKIGGKLYAVFERTYAIYPQGSGSMTIQPIIFQGQISRGSAFFRSPFGRQARTVIVQSEPVTLNVKPIPAEFKGNHWLPAQEVSLTEEWSEYPLEFRVDEPLTRTLILTAVGLTPSQLPEFPGWQEDAFKQYPDQPVLEDDHQDKHVVGRRIEKIAMIPNRTGDFTLPEIRIPWWNTNTHKMEYAVLPERDIKVVPAANQVQNQPDIMPPPISDLDLENEVFDPDSGQVNIPAGAQDKHDNGESQFQYWQWLSLLLFLAWAITSFMWYRSTRNRHETKDSSRTEPAVDSVIKKIKKSCLENNPAAAKESLLQWGRLTWPEGPPASIGEIGSRSNNSLRQEIHQLNHILYGRNRSEWQGEVLWKAFAGNLKNLSKDNKQSKGRLEPLFRI